MTLGANKFYLYKKDNKSMRKTMDQDYKCEQKVKESGDDLFKLLETRDAEIE